MIQLDLPADMTAAEHWAVTSLIDLSRLLPCDDLAADVVGLGLGAGEGIVAGEGRVTIGRGTLARVVAVAGAGTEQRSTARDRHDRVPAGENPVVASGGERSPVIQKLANTLRTTVIAAAGRRAISTWSPGGRSSPRRASSSSSRKGGGAMR